MRKINLKSGITKTIVEKLVNRRNISLFQSRILLNATPERKINLLNAITEISNLRIPLKTSGNSPGGVSSMNCAARLT